MESQEEPVHQSLEASKMSSRDEFRLGSICLLFSPPPTSFLLPETPGPAPHRDSDTMSPAAGRGGPHGRHKDVPWVGALLWLPTVTRQGHWYKSWFSV